MPTRRDFLAGALALSRAKAQPQATRHPNILWITCEDTSPDRVGCYGNPIAHTPALDALAARGTRYACAFSTSGVCAPARSTIITGVYATALGSQHMRSTIQLPPDIHCFSEYLRQAGYYCANNVKTDYNFAVPPAAWDDCSARAHWRNRPAGKPFFAIFNFTQTHEFEPRLAPDAYAKRTQALQPSQRQKREKQRIPPYYPDTPPVREEWARTLELTTAVDYEAAKLLRQLREDGLEDDTIIFFYADHGSGVPRAKRWLYDSGTQVPMIVFVPEKFREPGQGAPGTVARELVSFVDLAPTVLNLAGVLVPPHLQGRAFLGPSLTPEREFIYGTHDRQDERYEMVRMVRDRHFKYLRNYMPDKPYFQYMNSSETGFIMPEIRRAYAAGTLPPGALRFMAAHKAPEELYDLTADPFELHNLAADEAYRPTLERMRAAHVRWEEETRDLGWIPEPELYTREKARGTRTCLFAGSGGLALQRRARAAYAAGERRDQKALLEAATDPDAVVRYWALLRLRVPGAVQRAFRDDNPSVRIASASAGLRCGLAEPAAALLATELGSTDEMVRLLAANVLDEAGEFARPHLAAIRTAKTDARNQTTYVGRVANHTLNVLLERHETAR